MRSRSTLVFVAAVALVAAACGSSEKPEPQPAAGGPAPDANGFTAPTQKTTEANAAFGKNLDLAEQRDFDEAKQGLIEADPNVEITLAKDKIWSPKLFSFVQGDAPASVNPSLWRQAKL